jgi:3-oxoacyl-[acyl-carrier protein] reductase
MDLGVANKTAFVQGGGGGLGRAIAVTLAREGANVALADINEEALQQTAKAIAAVGGKSMSLKWDLGDLSLIEPRIAAIEANFGTLDIVINNTGGPPPTTVAGQSAETWLKHFNSMVLSVIAIGDRVLSGMRQRKWGRVITSTSAGVIEPIPNLGISNTLRLSLVGWSKTLAREVAADGITANVVVPGRILTDRMRFLNEAKAKREGRTLESVEAEAGASIPAGRLGEPQEYADVVTFLASERASYVTGCIVRVDGGVIASI